MRQVTTLLDSFAQLHQRNPHAPLIHAPGPGRSLTIDDVWGAHLAYAQAFRDRGLRSGHLLLVAIGNRPAVAALQLAARALDVAVLAVDAGTTESELAELSERFRPAALVTPGGVTPPTGRKFELPDGLQLMVLDTGGPGRYAGVAMLKLTSGSTGLPKATRTTEAQLVIDSQQIVQGMSIGPGDTQIASIPLSHAYGVSVILVPLLLQGTPMVLRESFVPHQLPADARTYGATTFAGVPFMFDYFLSNPPDDGWPPQLSRLISAGARLPLATVTAFHQRFGVKVHSFYGASESGGISYDADDAPGDRETVGQPLPGVRITFRHEDGVPEGTGRVHVSSGGVSSGYIDDVVEEFSDGGFLTGDYGALDSAGRLMLTGRVSSFINVAGKKVQPAEVEEVLRQMPGVRDVRVMAAADPRRGEQVVACLAVDPRDADSVTVLTVRRFCSQRLAPFKIPRTVVVLDAIPLTPRGKTDRRALDDAVRARIAGITQQLC